MRLMVEFQSEDEARRACHDLHAVGFDDESVRVDHPFEGGTLVTVAAFGNQLPVAMDVLRRHEELREEGEEPRPMPAL